MRRPVNSHEPFIEPGSFPSRMTLASVTDTPSDPANDLVFVPTRFSTTSSDESRSPYFGLKPPAVSSKFSTVSGLKALVSPNRRYGLWISTPSITVRF